jgi:hypothetical protein
MTSLAATDLVQHVAELRYCIEELHRRQTTDWGRAWLWQLKENAAKQALAMLQTEADDLNPDELSAAQQQRLITSHFLLQDPRAASTTSDVPRWRRELQARARQALQQSFELFQHREQNNPASQE